MTMRHRHPRSGPAESDRLRRLATNASVAVALTLILAKLAAYWVTEAVSILSSLIDSTTDLLASVVALVGVRHALRPADQHHRFGHGKAEALATLAQAAFITGSALLLTVEAVRRLFRPEPVNEGMLGIAAMLLSIVLTLALVAFQRSVVRRTGSLAVGADSLHYSGDLFMNLAVIAAILLTQWTGIPALDPLFGMGIAAFLLFGAWRILGQALDVLMDHELPEADRQRIHAIVHRSGEAKGMHDLRTRSSGTETFIDFHLELDPQLSVATAHDVTERIERALLNEFPNADINIHQEPHGLADDRLDNRLKKLHRG
jgi:ferrous-iron efflux pump FieF